ncbi:MAG: PAS domain S-box protein [Kofleriaceae bacterium]|nr:PAS domain S-box protein [Kofleriaceae bacterium]
MSDDRSSSMPAQVDLLRATVDNTPAMVSYWDADQRCRFANRAYERWWGISPDAMIGMRLSEVLGPSYEHVRPYIEAALRGTPQEYDSEFPSPTGGAPNHRLATVTPDVADGVVRGIVVVVTDITAIKQTERALRESEERFRLTIDEAPIGMALIGPDGRFVRVNRALCELVGYSAAELVGMSFRALIHPDDLRADLSLAGQLARGEIPRYQLGKRYIRKDGSIVDVKVSASVLRDSGGAPIHIIAEVEDITEQKRAEAEQRFLAASGPVFADSLDFEETLTRIADRVAHEMADLCMIDILETETEPRFMQTAGRDPGVVALCDQLGRIPRDRSRPYLMRRVFETREPLLVQRPSVSELEAFSASARHLEALRRAQIHSMIQVPLLVHGRLIGGIVLISSTPARTYGASDVRLAEALALRAAASIENARLYRSARRATQVRDDVLGIVAHDLRNPLGNIMLQAELMEELASGDRLARAIGAIERSASRMQRLIQDLLDVAQLEAGKLSVELGRVPVRSLLADSIEAQRALAHGAGLEIALELLDDGLEVYGDRDRIIQILENLIGNAIKFSEPGGTITVGATRRAGEALFVVSDTGRGIAPAALPHLFDRFWQADRRDRRQGAGLGLAIVKGLVEAHGGRIWVESTQGRGTTFYFTLPLAPQIEHAASATL